MKNAEQVTALINKCDETMGKIKASQSVPTDIKETVLPIYQAYKLALQNVIGDKPKSHLFVCVNDNLAYFDEVENFKGCPKCGNKHINSVKL